jgi:hypothetical protein
MAKPKIFLLGPSRYAYRLEIRFVNADGKLLKFETWEIRQEPDEKHRVLLLHANARLLGDKPRLEELGQNYVAITVAVAALEGELSTGVLVGFQPEPLNQRIAAFPLTVTVIVAQDGLSFSLYTANQKTNE